MLLVKRLRGRALQKRNARLYRRQPLCVDCLVVGRIRLARQQDHIEPLSKGGEDREGNLQPLCEECHEIKTARDMGYILRGGDVHGMPLDPAHHWNLEDIQPALSSEERKAYLLEKSSATDRDENA